MKSRTRRLFKMIISILLGLIALFFVIAAVGRLINAQKYKISSESGVQKTEFINLGGIEQYVQIRGQDASNPVIVFLHGGPGNNAAYYSYYWQAELEKNYTIIHWDQRGSGNTYYRDKEAEKPTLDLLLSDLDELVDYICAEYDKEKVVIMGHSWGTLLGGIYASQRPDKVSAYVGVGQFSDVWNSEKRAAYEAARLARAAGRDEDAVEIEEQFQAISSSPKINMSEFLRLRKLTGKYLPTGKNAPASAVLFSPYATLSDLRWFLSPIFGFDAFIERQDKLFDKIYSEGGLSMYDYAAYEVPVIIVAGGCDWITPFDLAQDYFDSVSAPEKEFILIENAGHIPFEPGEFTEALLNALNNIL